jgi:hypothetical protein
VGECLRERTDLRLVEAATSRRPSLSRRRTRRRFVVDEPERDVVAALAQLRAIVIVDDVPRGAAATAERVRLLARPFTAEGLLAEVVDLLG